MGHISYQKKKPLERGAITPDARFELATNGLTVLFATVFYNSSKRVTALILGNYKDLFNA
ncbi:MAG: hypothetical protein COT84_07525 [Chlamydiae bacterium CG10_big_fil_rev_8_21_14_0_10_35_9]|nr:MAG: hypothetical protein COT84_07525 [Chlamydiae bacterium CG10_big_fil_rev_8_21_14_0_10_35_9]